MMTEPFVDVTQEDREIAAVVEIAQFALYPDIAEKVAQLTTAGKRDRTITVQAFARHRLAQRKTGFAAIKRLLKACSFATNRAKRQR